MTIETDDRTELERAIHHLREAEMMHNPDEYNVLREDPVLEYVDDALTEIEAWLDFQFNRHPALNKEDSEDDTRDIEEYPEVENYVKLMKDPDDLEND